MWEASNCSFGEGEGSVGKKYDEFERMLLFKNVDFAAKYISYLCYSTEKETNKENQDFCGTSKFCKTKDELIAITNKLNPKKNNLTLQMLLEMSQRFLNRKGFLKLGNWNSLFKTEKNKILHIPGNYHTISLTPNDQLITIIYQNMQKNFQQRALSSEYFFELPLKNNYILFTKLKLNNKLNFTSKEISTIIIDNNLSRKISSSLSDTSKYNPRYILPPNYISTSEKLVFFIIDKKICVFTDQNYNALYLNKIFDFPENIIFVKIFNNQSLLKNINSDGISIFYIWLMDKYQRLYRLQITITFEIEKMKITDKIINITTGDLEEVPNHLTYIKQISLSENDTNIWGTDINNNLYHRNGFNGFWLKIHQELFKQVEVSKNGTTLYIIDSGNNLFQLKLNLHYLRQQNYIDDLKTRINNFFNNYNYKCSLDNKEYAIYEDKNLSTQSISYLNEIYPNETLDSLACKSNCYTVNSLDQTINGKCTRNDENIILTKNNNQIQTMITDRLNTEQNLEIERKKLLEKQEQAKLQKELEHKNKINNFYKDYYAKKEFYKKGELCNNCSQTEVIQNVYSEDDCILKTGRKNHDAYSFNNNTCIGYKNNDQVEGFSNTNIFKLEKIPKAINNYNLQPNNSGCRFEKKQISNENMFVNIKYQKPVYISNNHNVSSTSKIGYNIKPIKRKNLRDYTGFKEKFGIIKEVNDDKINEISEWISKNFSEVLGIGYIPEDSRYTVPPVFAILEYKIFPTIDIDNYNSLVNTIKFKHIYNSRSGRDGLKYYAKTKYKINETNKITSDIICEYLIKDKSCKSSIDGDDISTSYAYSSKDKEKFLKDNCKKLCYFNENMNYDRNAKYWLFDKHINFNLDIENKNERPSDCARLCNKKANCNEFFVDKNNYSCFLSEGPCDTIPGNKFFHYKKQLESINLPYFENVSNEEKSKTPHIIGFLSDNQKEIYVESDIKGNITNGTILLIGGSDWEDGLTFGLESQKVYIGVKDNKIFTGKYQKFIRGAGKITFFIDFYYNFETKKAKIWFNGNLLVNKNIDFPEFNYDQQNKKVSYMNGIHHIETKEKNIANYSIKKLTIYQNYSNRNNKTRIPDDCSVFYKFNLGRYERAFNYSINREKQYAEKIGNSVVKVCTAKKVLKEIWMECIILERLQLTVI